MDPATELPWPLDAAGNAVVGAAVTWSATHAKQAVDYVCRRDELAVWIRHAVGEQFGPELQSGEFDALRRAFQGDDAWRLLGRCR
ncbi:MAG: hypothetical protein ACOYEV_10150 [Candidatus Nanopelagicales bacterium]